MCFCFSIPPIAVDIERKYNLYLSPNRQGREEQQGVGGEKENVLFTIAINLSFGYICYEITLNYVPFFFQNAFYYALVHVCLAVVCTFPLFH